MLIPANEQCASASLKNARPADDQRANRAAAQADEDQGQEGVDVEAVVEESARRGKARAFINELIEPLRRRNEQRDGQHDGLAGLRECGCGNPETVILPRSSGGVSRDKPDCLSPTTALALSPHIALDGQTAFGFLQARRLNRRRPNRATMASGTGKSSNARSFI